MKKIRLKSIIAIFLAILMILPLSLNLFNKNATAEDGSTDDNEVIDDTYVEHAIGYDPNLVDYGINTMDTGLLTSESSYVPDFHINDQAYLSRWQGTRVAFFYHSGLINSGGSTTMFESKMTGAKPVWGIAGTNTTFNTGANGKAISNSMNTNWLTFQIGNTTTGYRAICMDPLLPRWSNGTEQNNIGAVIRIDRDAMYTADIPDEYKALRRLMWYSYFGGGGMYYDYATSNNPYYNQTGTSAHYYNLEARALNDTSAGSIQAQYVLLHTTASYIKDLSVAKYNAGKDNYGHLENGGYPALGNTDGGSYTYGDGGTYIPKLNGNTLDDSTAGYNLVKTDGGLSRLNKTATDAVKTLYGYVSGTIGQQLDPYIPDGFVVYVGISKLTTKQSYVIYTIEDAPAVRVVKKVNDNYNPNVGNPVGAEFGIYDSKLHAQSGENPLGTVTIKGYYDILSPKGYWSDMYIDHGKQRIYSFTGPNSSTNTYKYYVKEISPPTNTPANYRWDLDTEIHEVTAKVTGWGAADHEATIGTAVYATSNNNLIPTNNTGYFKFTKTSNENKPYNGMQFQIYTDAAATVKATNDVVPSQSGTGYNVNANGLITITNTSNTNSFTIGNIKVNLGEATAKTLYIQEVTVPSITGGAWSKDSRLMVIDITTSNTNSNPATGKYFQSFNNEFTPNNQQGYFRLKKIADDTQYNNNLRGAKFTIYTDRSCTQVVSTTVIPNQSIGTNATLQNGVITLTGTTSSGVTTNPIRVELGTKNAMTFYIKETTFPANPAGATWITNDNVKSFTVYSSHTQSSPLLVQFTNYTKENDRWVGVFILRKNLIVDGTTYEYPSTSRTGILNKNIQSLNTYYSLAGAQFDAYLDSNGRDYIGTMTVGDGTYQTLEQLFRGQAGSSVLSSNLHYYCTNGIYWIKDETEINTSSKTTIGGIEMVTGNYIYVKETKLPSQYAKWTPLDYELEKYAVIYIPYSTFTAMRAGLQPPIQVGGGTQMTWPTWDTLYPYTNTTYTPSGSSFTRPPARYNVWTNKAEQPVYGTITLTKKPSLEGGASNASVAGAQYTFYTNAACTNIAWNIAEDGVATIPDSDTITINNVYIGYKSTNDVATYYVKETKVPDTTPNGFKWTLDKNVYTITLRANPMTFPGTSGGRPITIGTSATVESIDRLIPLYGYLQLYKSSNVQNADYSNVKFTIYKDANCTQIAQGIWYCNGYSSSGIPTNFVKCENGVISAYPDGTVPMIRVEMNSAYNFSLSRPDLGDLGGGLGTGWKQPTLTSEERTLYIKETSYPSDNQLTNPIPGGDRGHWVVTNRVYKVVVRYDNTVTQPYSLSIYNTAVYPSVAALRIAKVPEDTGNYTIDPMLVAGAKYGIYKDAACTRPMQLSNRMPATLTINATGTSPILIIDLDYDDNVDVYIKEISPPTHNPPGWEWQLSDEVIQVTLTAINDLSNYSAQMATAIFEEPIEPAEGYVRIYKTVPALSATGAEYTVYNDAHCTSIATDVGNRGVIAIGSTQDTSGGRQPYPYMSAITKVPLGTGTLSSDGYGRRLWIKETKAPSATVTDGSWGLDSRVYSVLITPNNIISSPVIVTSADQLYYNFTLQKEVRGNYGHRYEKFQFGLVGQTATGAILSGTFNTELTDATGKKTNSTITFDSNTGVALVQLAHGESLKILNLPYNSVILVGEQKPVGYTMTISYDNGPESKVTSGTAIMNAAHTMKFINSRSFVPATGIISTIGIGLAILIPSGAGLAILAKKRKED